MRASNAEALAVVDDDVVIGVVTLRDVASIEILLDRITDNIIRTLTRPPWPVPSASERLEAQPLPAAVVCNSIGDGPAMGRQQEGSAKRSATTPALSTRRSGRPNRRPSAARSNASTRC